MLVINEVYLSKRAEVPPVGFLLLLLKLGLDSNEELSDGLCSLCIALACSLPLSF